MISKFLVGASFLASSLAFGASGQEIFESRCAMCHGNQGSETAAPVLHGQEPRYLKDQLQAFKAGTRTDQMMHSMGAIAAAMTDEEIQTVSTYLAGQDPCAVEMNIDYERDGFREDFLAGKKKSEEANCMHCHGSFHHAAPRLYGQKSSFIKAALAAFKSDQRTGQPMNNIAKALEDEDIERLSIYFNGMRLMRYCPK